MMCSLPLWIDEISDEYIPEIFALHHFKTADDTIHDGRKDEDDEYRNEQDSDDDDGEESDDDAERGRDDPDGNLVEKSLIGLEFYDR